MSRRPSLSFSLTENKTVDSEHNKKRLHRRDDPCLPKIPLPLVPLEIIRNQILRQLKSRLRPLSKHPIYGGMLDSSDSMLLKWLLVCDYNVLLAYAKIRKCLEYRHHKIDELLTDFQMPTFAEYYPGGLCGLDKVGSPVYYEMLGKLNMKDIMSTSTKENLIKFKIYQHEKMVQHLKKLSRDKGVEIDTILVVVDMESCNKDTVWGPALRMWAEIIEVLQQLYPGLVKEVLVINHHSLYSEMYLFLRPYLSRSTLKLIKVFGDGYLKHLMKRIPKHEIPACYGGYKCDFNNNPRCTAQLNWNTQFPQYLHLSNKRMAAQVNKRSISPGDKRVEEYHVPTPMSQLVWKFYHLSHPIMTAFYLNIMDSTSMVVERTLISPSDHGQGMLTCVKPGRYLLVLDNCKNFAQAATVTFSVEVLQPFNIMSKLTPQIPIGYNINYWEPINETERKAREKHFNKYPQLKV